MNSNHTTPSRDAILAATANGYDVFRHYLAAYYPSGRIEPGRNISNPFLSDRQKTPSFNIYQDTSGIWHFKDFAHADCTGDCFDLAARMNGLNTRSDFPAVLQRIQQHCGLTPHNSTPRSAAPALPFTIIPQEFTPSDHEYWGRPGIGPDTLTRYGVLSLESYTTEGTDGTPYTIRARPHSPIYAYPYGPDAFKIYRPNEAREGKRFRFIGRKPEGLIWGFDQLPEHCELIVIAAGEKDALAAIAHGFPAVTLNSETARLSSAARDALQARCTHLVCCYDTDSTGRAAAAWLWAEHGIITVPLPSWIADGDGKDLSDFFQLGGTTPEFSDMITEAILTHDTQQQPTEAIGDSPDEEELSPAARFISLRDLLESAEEELPFLVEYIIPAVGVSAVVGIPDSGKSQFTRHLALSIVTSTDFIGLKITPRHRCVAVVITEESTGQVRSSLLRQLQQLADVPHDAIHILPANMLSHEEVLETIEAFLQVSPCDLVIIDSFGDIFAGRDANSTADMRKALKPFDTLAQRYTTALLFVHHLGKASYRATPDQSQVLNSAAFVQKCRSVIDLRYELDDPLTKYLSITKANGVSVEVKQQARVLTFDESTLTFRFTGQFKPVTEINAEPVDLERARKKQDARQLRHAGKSVREIARQLGVGKSTIGEWVAGIHSPEDSEDGQPDTGELW